MPAYDVVIVGAGQAGLATAFHLRRSGLRFAILEAQQKPHGSWPSYYDSLRLFSPARYSSLPGLPFPGDPAHYATRDEVIEYLQEYARRFEFPIIGSTSVRVINRIEAGFIAECDQHRAYAAGAVVAAAGSFRVPHVPVIQGEAQFSGIRIHSSAYRNETPFLGSRVVVVGAANSAVQIAVELARGADVTLATRDRIRFLPQRFLGRDIHFWFKVTGLDRSRLAKDQATPVIDAGGYRAALAAGRPRQKRMFRSFTPEGVIWQDGSRERVDAVIFATGYRQEFPFLSALPNALNQQRGVSVAVPGLYFVGLSGQTGLASATLRGVGPDAREIVGHLVRALSRQKR
jgi:putative flavoprotein involved in K+ transport